MAKDSRIAFRASEEMKKRLAEAAKAVGLSETTLAEACVEALIEYIEEHGEIRFPLTVVPRMEAKKNLGLSGTVRPSSSISVPGPESLSDLRLNEDPAPGPKPVAVESKRPGKRIRR